MNIIQVKRCWCKKRLCRAKTLFPWMAAAFLVLAGIEAHAGDIYKWRDAAGVLHFSNEETGLENAERYGAEAEHVPPPEVADEAPPSWTTGPIVQPPKPRDSAEFAAAVDDLKRIDAAVRSGVVFQDYSAMVNAARFALDRLGELPGRCDDCDKLEEIYGMYENAGHLWAYQLKNQYGDVIDLMIEINEEKFNKYPYRENNKYRWVMGAENCRQDLWAEAGERLGYY